MSSAPQQPDGVPVPRARLNRVRAEQRAFDSQIDDLLDKHAGEFVVFHDEQPVAFYPTHAEAYADALKVYGSEGVFLVSQVKKRSPRLSQRLRAHT